MSKLSNILSMLKLLENGRIYKIKELADLLECSERSIRTYKEELEKSGIYVESISGRYGGYYISSNYDIMYFNINKLDLNNLENLYLKLYRNNIDNIEVLSNIIDKLRYQLIFSSNKSKKTNTDKYVYKYDMFSNAISKKQTLSIRYKNKIYDFLPQSLYVYSDDYFVTGINIQINQIRTYNLNDVEIIENL